MKSPLRVIFPQKNRLELHRQWAERPVFLQSATAELKKTLQNAG